MAGTIVADTIQDGAGNSTAMDNAIYGSAKAWVNYNGTGTPIEIVKVTARSGDVFTIVRAQEGTSASSFSGGDKVELRITAGEMNAIETAINAINPVASGAIYENSNTITSNYTITTGKNAVSAGPVTISTGVTVTTPTGSRWVIV